MPGGALIVGSAGQRFDIPDKVTGKPRFVHDMVLPGMLYGRVARPPSPDAELIDVDLAAVNALPGVVATVRDGRFLGVIAEREELVVKALKKLIAAADFRSVRADQLSEKAEKKNTWGAIGCHAHQQQQQKQQLPAPRRHPPTSAWKRSRRRRF